MLFLLALALGAFAVSWAGCSAGSQTSTTGAAGAGATESTGTKMTTGTGMGGTGAGGSAAGGGGGGPSCKADQKACNGTCVMIGDPMYGCGPSTCTPCAAPGMNATTSCVMMAGVSTCSIACTAGFSDCDGNPANGCETDTGTDPQNCGACGAPCSVPHATAGCKMGMCTVATCDTGWVDCNGKVSDGCESNPSADNNNCGTCGNVCTAPVTCGLVTDADAGTVVDDDGGVPLNDAGVPIATCNLYCPKGKTNCDGNPADGCNVQLGTNTDCTMCGDTCNLANSMSSCQPMGSGFVCTLQQCNTGFANCDMVAANGCEVDTMTDANNCGSCGNKCPSGPNSTAVCVNGGCAINCAPGFADCDNNPNDGCEIDVNNDTNNCGVGNAGCGHVCVTPNATPVCSSGMCEIQQCNPGFADCDMNPANGCEINTGTNPNDCGNCGAVCNVPNAQAACNNGMCAVGTCNTGFSDCDGLVSNGCEDPTGTDANNCGMCGNKCNLPNATATCTGGTCQVAACNPGFQDCDHQPNDGCEVNLQGDPLNCGACNKQCFVNNGSAGCSNGSCTVASCNPGFADCNNNPGDGCETPITTTSNCGACGNNCVADCVGNVTATQCTSGTCEVLACASGTYDVDGKCANGCECTTKGTSSSCNAPTGLGQLSVGQVITYTGNLVPAGQEAYLSVTFTGNANFSYHPRVTLTTGAGEFECDILDNCAGNLMSCGVEGGSSNGRTAWEEDYTAGDPNNATNFDPIPAVGTNGTVLIHVYRRAGQALTCDNYTLTIGN
jgi:hypothetical protein